MTSDGRSWLEGRQILILTCLSVVGLLVGLHQNSSSSSPLDVLVSRTFHVLPSSSALVEFQSSSTTIPSTVNSTANDSRPDSPDHGNCRSSALEPPPRTPNSVTAELELELEKAKVAIANASSPSYGDEALYGPLYNDVSAFSRSYELMEKRFRVYTYNDGSSPFVGAGPLTGIYASEGHFIRKLMGSRFDEEDPNRAHMFFLPFSVARMVDSLYVPGSHDMSPITHFVTSYVDSLLQNHPFWNRSNGADHFFVSCHDWGPATARGHAQLRANAAKVVCNANLSEEFVPGKDASLPETYIHSSKGPKLGGAPPGKRVYLAFFAGGMHGHVRPLLAEFWQGRDPRMRVFGELGRASYVQHMKRSKFCICPAGWEVNSPRLVEAISFDCVPVIISDRFVLPFGDVLNWSSFSVSVPERDIPNLRSILLGISPSRYRSMQRRLAKVRRHFLWHDPPLRYDAFHMILHSVWTSRLNRTPL